MFWSVHCISVLVALIVVASAKSSIYLLSLCQSQKKPRYQFVLDECSHMYLLLYAMPVDALAMHYVSIFLFSHPTQKPCEQCVLDIVSLVLSSSVIDAITQPVADPGPALGGVTVGFGWRS
jgi:hypothetical protein